MANDALSDRVAVTHNPLRPQGYPDSAAQRDEFSLDVVSLGYVPAFNRLTEARERLYAYVSSKSARIKAYLPGLKPEATSSTLSVLENVSCRVAAGKLTGIVGPKSGERKSLLSILSCRCTSGELRGEVVMKGTPFSSHNVNLNYKYNVAFVPHDSFDIPGLTYREMLEFSARLRVRSHGKTDAQWTLQVLDNVRSVIEIMGLTDVQHTKMLGHTPRSGQEISERRRVCIANEIITLPVLIAVEEPFKGLELAYAKEICDRLKLLAARGHAVLCSLDKPAPKVFQLLDNVVVLSEGHSIYSGPVAKIESFFTSRVMGYSRRQDTELVDFVLDIASGTERSDRKRIAEPAEMIQEKFETSSFFDSPSSAGASAQLLKKDRVVGYGYTSTTPWRFLRRSGVVIRRALLVKLRDFEIIKKTIGSSLIVGAAVGYIQYNQGNYGYYTMTITTLPYPQTSNVTALLFFVSIFCFVQQAINVHVVVKKFEQFRIEQAAQCTPALSFVVATFLSEVPFTILGAVVFSSIVYFEASLNVGASNYFFFVEACSMIAIVGTTTALMLTALLHTEFAVRDTYLTFSFLMVLISGFPFQLPGVRDYIAALSQINPMRWVYEALMQWKFGSHYKDGTAYIGFFNFAAFSHEKVFEILLNFVLFSGLLTVLFTLPKPNLLHRKSAPEDASGVSRESMDSNDEEAGAARGGGAKMTKRLSVRGSLRGSETVKPLIFSKHSSVSLKSSLSISMSEQGLAVDGHGPTVLFKGLSYQVKCDKKSSPSGHRAILSNITGQFDWGKLSLIIGSSESGKSSLLRLLSGERGIAGSDISGDILFDNKKINPLVPLWQRCAYVETGDDFHRDLTVREVVQYAMMLRCINRLALSVVNDNVAKTLDILKLTDISGKKTKNLLPGERRRLSIAEEIVHGPSLLLIDEPTHNLGPADESVMMRVFREMVNQDKTVIATMRQPSAVSFGLFDTVLLLSKGRVIFHGSGEDAVNFFVHSPYKFDYSNYSNPADFLIDVSRIAAESTDGDMSVDALENYYLRSDISNKRRKRTNTEIIMSLSGNSGQVASINTSFEDTSGDSPRMSANIDREKQDGATSYYTMAQQAFHSKTVITVCCDYMRSFRNTNISNLSLKLYTLFSRSSMALLGRKKLVLGSLLLHIALACLFGWILGQSSGQVYNLTSFFAVAALLLMISNIQLVRYMFDCHKVFLKENSRELYSTATNWSVSNTGLYTLKALNGLVFALISHNVLGLSSGEGVTSFFLFSIVMTTLAGFALAEAVITLAPTMRDAYTLVPSSTFFHFTFCGLFIKLQSLPDWMSWLPNLSIIRWSLQGEFMNEFYGNVCTISATQTQVCAFPTIVGSSVNYSTWDALLALFSWNNQSKWSCVSIVVANVVAYRLLTLFVSGIWTIKRRRQAVAVETKA